MRVRVLYFAAVRDLVGTADETIDLPADVITVGAFSRFIVTRHNALEGRLSSVRIARNEAFANDHDGITDGDVLALIPPVAGG